MPPPMRKGGPIPVQRYEIKEVVVNSTSAITQNKDLVGQITIGGIAQISVGVDTNFFRS